MLLKDNFLTTRNPEASMDLRISVALQPESDKDYVKHQLRKNIRLPKREWVESQPENKSMAVICGSSPSLIDNIESVREQQADGAIIYACNRAAQVLCDNGVVPDYQVILDPHEIMLSLICKQAKGHLFAAIVNPLVMSEVPNAKIWFPMMQWVADEMQWTKRQFTYIGGGITVSNFALCLAYTLGHRKLTAYGMDSSYRDDFHATGEKASSDDDRLLVDVEHAGKRYKTTYDMVKQAEVFIILAEALHKAGMKIQVVGQGLLPDIFNQKEVQGE